MFPLTLALLCALAAPPPPVSDTYHGVTVADPLRWLEDPQAPEVKAFIERHNREARAFLDQNPGRERVRARLAEILGAATTIYRHVDVAGGQVFALKTQPPKQHPFLVVMPSADEPEKARTVIDPDALDPQHETAIDWYRVSPDGKLVAASMSTGGSETGDVHVFEVATGKRVFEVVPGVNAGTAGGDLAWQPDSKGFY